MSEFVQERLSGPPGMSVDGMEGGVNDGKGDE
jgi:hypothetical protein